MLRTMACSQSTPPSASNSRLTSPTSSKDSDDAIFHADGTLARGPIAVCEVQGYAYAAWRAGAALAEALSQPELATKFVVRANDLKCRFEDVFWCDELSTYALALDGDKQPCRVRSSNAG